jgi:hypothetical protein
VPKPSKRLAVSIVNRPMTRVEPSLSGGPLAVPGAPKATLTLGLATPRGAAAGGAASKVIPVQTPGGMLAFRLGAVTGAIVLTKGVTFRRGAKIVTSSPARAGADGGGDEVVALPAPASFLVAVVTDGNGLAIGARVWWGRVDRRRLSSLARGSGRSQRRVAWMSRPKPCAPCAPPARPLHPPHAPNRLPSRRRQRRGGGRQRKPGLRHLPGWQARL